MPRSGIREVMELAGAIDGAIHLETGEPNFTTPRHICEAAAQAAFDGFTKYTPNAGIMPLREALAAKVRERNGIDAAAEQVVVTSGAVAGIYSSMVSLVDPGAEMLLGDPSWPNYAQMMQLLKISPVHFPLRPEADLVPQAADVEPLITERTRAIMLNSPGNPTGAVTDAAALADLMELARRHDLLVFSDEVYDEISFDGSLHLGRAARCRRSGDHLLQFLQDLRHDRLAGRLPGRSAWSVAPDRAGAGADHVMRQRPRADGSPRRGDRPAGVCGRDARRLPAPARSGDRVPEPVAASPT